MWKLRSVSGLLLLCCSLVLVAGQGSRNRWQTLSGGEPLVIARGGFSGLFPDSSLAAYSLAVGTGLANVTLWCDVQLTSDGAGICFPDIRLNNGSDIDTVYANRSNTYPVNGVSTRGWFSVDFTLDELAPPVLLRQRINSRYPAFGNLPLQILTVDEVFSVARPPPRLWLNVPYDGFFSQHNLSMRSFIISVSRSVIVNYISSPEVGFLRSIVSRFRTGPTRLVFQFLGPNDVEPSTNQTYSSLLSNLTLIRSFASGIIVPKYYIWPVDNRNYLQNYTSLVLDAHRAGLEIYASNFANDATLPYDDNYDPVSEYLSYVDNGIFSVDGVLTDFPVTPSATIDCFAHMGRNDTVQADLLVISNEGASGVYPGCTDRAYEQAVTDNVDILDCPVQMSYDGIPFCLGSINLRDRTDAAQSNFSNLATTNPDLNIEDGIFAYNLTWSQIQTLRPAMYNPFTNYTLVRNPRARSEGSFMQLSDFLAFANNASSVSGVLISIENAAYLAANQGLGVTDAVLNALSTAGYNNQTAKRILIKSSESAVLSTFSSSRSNYELVYVVDEDVSDITNSTISEIRRFANSVAISRRSVYPTDELFLTGQTDIVPKLLAFNLTVYVQFFYNEFVAQPWDFFSDPYAEINTHAVTGINGVVTDFPGTASRYKRNRCLGYRPSPPIYMSPVQPGSLLPLISPGALSPAEAPNPVLTDDDIALSPLPPVAARRPTGNTDDNTTAVSPTPGNGQATLVSSTIVSIVSLLVGALVL